MKKQYITLFAITLVFSGAMAISPLSAHEGQSHGSMGGKMGGNHMSGQGGMMDADRMGRDPMGNRNGQMPGNMSQESGTGMIDRKNMGENTPMNSGRIPDPDLNRAFSDE